MSEIPCIEMNVSDNEAMELALIENMQRKDLDIFEEADGLKVLIDLYGYSHEQVSKKIGKARSTVTEIINIGRIPKEIRKLCAEYGITSRSTVIEIAKQKSKEDMYRLVTEIKKRELKREDTRELSQKIKGKVQKEKGFVYRYEGKDKKFKLKIEFMRGEVSGEEIIEILEDIIYKLKEK
jgi:ParB family chromosome partitioning protein